LGLAISRQLAELLEGNLHVASEPGLGSTFTISLPYEPAQSRPEPLMHQPTGEAETHLQPAHILLAEDHDINRMLVTAMLERCGQHVTIARDGEQAIEAVLEAHSQSRPFDLVFMDIQMPGCDGYTATRAIRAEGIRASQLPIIALTANAYPEDIAAAREAGMQGHLAKPLAFADLVKALERWLPVRIVEEPETAPIDIGDEAVLRPQALKEDCVRAALPNSLGQLASSPETKRASKSSPSSRSAPKPAPTPAPTPSHTPSHTPQIVHSPSLVERWQVRRQETLDAVSAALRDAALTGDQAEALAKLVHTLAGTAGMFGEGELGECATTLERALLSDSPIIERQQLAQQLLDVAQRKKAPIGAEAG
jgi:CheY-like chemotaxis protein/HPt (histidine-containing phosphotransfer) domain-containing protein